MAQDIEDDREDPNRVQEKLQPATLLVTPDPFSLSLYYFLQTYTHSSSCAILYEEKCGGFD